MIVVDSEGNLFDERRKDSRRKKEDEVEIDRRVEDRRNDTSLNLDEEENQED